MARLFDYIFYRVYKTYQKRDNNPEIYASGILSVIQFFTLLSFLAIIRMVYDFPIPNKYLILPLIVLLIGINWFRYERNLNIEELDSRWKEEDPTQTRKKGWLIILYVVVSILFPIMYGILKHNLNLI